MEWTKSTYERATSSSAKTLRAITVPGSGMEKNPTGIRMELRFFNEIEVSASY